MTASQIVTADLVWTDGQFRADTKVRVDGNGCIAEVGNFKDPPTIELSGHAIVPGMVNAHSHAFQRGLRGRGERFPAGAGSFWSWRDEMYGLVESLDERRFTALCEQAFREMLSCGITTVGEFHYMHHRTAADFHFDKLVLQAAANTGIRISLLNAFYATGGINSPLAPSQLRFQTSTLDAYWEQMAELEAAIQPRTQSLGVVAHSIRAVPIDIVCSLHGEATMRGMPFHMHVEEQRQEIEECVRAYGCTPMSLLTRETGIKGNLTAVHCTHSKPADIEEFFDAGGRACICPLTEANLGDGVPTQALIQEPSRLSLGTDSNARIAMTEEMRWLEYGQRWSREIRGAVRNQAGDVATPLFDIATRGGAATLRLQAGEIRAGAYADFVAIDLAHPSLTYTNDETLLPALIFGADNEAISDVCVGGQWLAIRST